MTTLTYQVNVEGAKKGKLEGRITVPTGGWAVAANDGGGADTATIPAGDYYLSSPDSGSNDLLAELKARLDTATAHTWTCTVSAGEGGTGKVTITTNAASTLAWTSTELRDALGFTGNLASATTFTSPNACRSLWLPGCPHAVHVPGAWEGMIETDIKVQESRAGHVFSFAGQRRTVLSIRWDAVAVARAWQCQEGTTNQSFEKFFLDVIYGEAEWSAKPCGPIRFHRDADDDATYVTYHCTGTKDLNLAQFVQDQGLLYRVTLPRLVKEPA